MIESFIHSDYQIPEITRKLTLAVATSLYHAFGGRVPGCWVQWDIAQVVIRAAMLRRSSSIAVIFVSSTRPDRELIRASFKASSAARETSA